MKTARLSVLFLLILTGCAVADPARGDRPGVEAVMKKMEAATLAGDAKAYLALVDQADAVFYKEQSNLAKDWSKHKADVVTLAIVETRPEEKPADAKPDAAKPDAAKKPEQKEEQVGVDSMEPRFDESRAEFRMQMTWKMPEWKRERTLTLPVVFVREAKEGQTGGGEWKFAGEKWDVVTIPVTDTFNGVRICYEPGNEKLKRTAELVGQVMPAVREGVDRHFKLKVPGPVTVKLYRSMRHLQASIWLSYTDGLAGWNEPGEAIKILPGTRSSADSLKGLLGHEYGHCATFTMGPHATDAAWWVLEGAAELASAQFKKGAAERRDARVRSWFKAGELADWEKIAPFPLPKEDEHLTPQVYTQGEHMLAFIGTRYGDDQRIAFVRGVCEGKSLDKSSRDAVGLPWADVDAAWRQSIQQQMDTVPRDDK
ncbi:MAG: hypothetical protein K2Q09_06200 [Phycisphaerales bacterium]|nr:hypothetical protein [Phycisphaerales bacterium]